MDYKNTPEFEKVRMLMAKKINDATINSPMQRNEVAKMWGVPLSTYDMWRRGKRIPHYKTMVRIYNETNGGLDLVGMLHEAIVEAHSNSEAIDKALQGLNEDGLMLVHQGEYNVIYECGCGIVNLDDCEATCERYSSCDNVAIMLDFLRDTVG